MAEIFVFLDDCSSEMSSSKITNVMLSSQFQLWGYFCYEEPKLLDYLESDLKQMQIIFPKTYSTIFQ